MSEFSPYSSVRLYPETGNAGMATAGSGDVLSGITGALAAYTVVNQREGGEGNDRRAAYFQAVCRAVYLHGLAGDLANSAICGVMITMPP